MDASSRRRDAIEDLYQGLSLFVRRSREIAHDLHVGLSVVDYTVLMQIDSRPGTRAADLSNLFGVDKSTISRQVNQLTEEGLLERTAERPGQRGFALKLTKAGKAALETAAESVRGSLTGWLDDWNDDEIAVLAGLLVRLNARIDERFG
jgi:DNA-binding MarR family transcriptional regulator